MCAVQPVQIIHGVCAVQVFREGVWVVKMSDQLLPGDLISIIRNKDPDAGIHMYLCVYVCMYACMIIRNKDSNAGINMYVCMYKCMHVCMDDHMKQG